jgi:hypothetical protein
MKRLIGYLIAIVVLLCIAIPALLVIPGLALVGIQIVHWPFGICTFTRKLSDTIGLVNSFWVLVSGYVALCALYEALTNFSRKRPFISPLCFTFALVTVHILVGIVLGNMGIIGLGDP